MPINVAIVEDDEASALRLKGHIERYAKENGAEFNIDTYSDGDEITDNYKPFYNIIFMDIEMRRQNGMAAAESIRKQDKTVIIIFITHMAQYALKGYAVDALSFLLKPVPYFAFSQELKRSVQKLRLRKEESLILPDLNGFAKVPTSEILFLESVGHKIIFHLSDKQYSQTASLKDMEKKLNQEVFVRCNNGYLVNLQYVSGIVDNCAVVGNHKLIISRPRKKAFMEALTAYFGGRR